MPKQPETISLILFIVAVYMALKMMAGIRNVSANWTFLIAISQFLSNTQLLNAWLSLSSQLSYGSLLPGIADMQENRSPRCVPQMHIIVLNKYNPRESEARKLDCLDLLGRQFC